MTPALSRPAAAPVAGLFLIGLDAALRLVLGRPYGGTTLVLLAACGLALVPFLPSRLRRPSLVVAILPALAVGAFAILLTTVSIAGVRLTEVSIRISVGVLVVALAAGSALVRQRDPPTWSWRREALVVGALAAVVAFALASAWDIAAPYQPLGTDLGHYLLYADEVAVQEHLLIDDPFAGEDDRVFADPAAVGALYGGVLILDGVSSWSLAGGIVVLSALSVMSVFVAAGAMWGAAAGIAAAAAYAVAPIRLDMMYWHGLGTTLALVFVPLVVLALALMFRGNRDLRVVALLSFSLVAVASSHATSAVVVAALVLCAPLLDVVRGIRAGPVEAVRASWRIGVLRPVVTALGLAAVLGAGVIVHLRRQAEDLGQPVDYRFLGPEWFDREAFVGYFSWSFLALCVIAVGVVIATARLRRDPAALGLLSLVLACIVVAELWRVEVAFEYRRVVYYLGIALVLTIGLAFVRVRRSAVLVAVFVLALAVIARGAVGLRLPERVLTSDRSETAVTVGLREFRQQLDDGRLPDTRLLVTDSCLQFATPYLVRRPTLPAFTERQVGFVNRLPLARKAAAVLEGGEAGRRLAERLGVGYAVVDPSCVPSLPERLGGKVVIGNDDLVVVQLPAASQ